MFTPIYATITKNILDNLVAFLAPIIGIAMIIFCIVQGFKIAKGDDNGSVKKLLMGIAFLLLIAGIMYSAKSIDEYGKLFKGTTDKVINQGGNDVKSIVGGD